MEKLRASTKSLIKLEEELLKLKKKKEENPTDDKIDEEINELEIKIENERESKGMSYQQVYKAEFILPNTQMSSSVGTRAGLSDIDGKLSVSDITPVIKDKHIGYQYGVRFDESQRSTILSPLLDKESIEKHKRNGKTKSFNKISY